MSKKRSLRTQLLYPIMLASKVGVSKRADKLNNVNTKKNIYSLGLNRHMAKLAKAFANFMSQAHPEIKWAKDITADHIQDYVDERYVQWSKRTAQEYKYFFGKLELLINTTYHCNVCFSPVNYKQRTTKKLKDQVMEDEDFKSLCTHMLSRQSKARFAPIMTHTIGARTEELCSIRPENIRLDKKVVELRNCKNGRNRDVPIRDEYLPLWREIKNLTIQYGWETVTGGLCLKSVRKSYRDSLKALGISQKYPYDCNHSIRKMYARRRFIEELEKGLTVDNAFSKVQVELGHGSKSRKELFRAYMCIDYDEFKEDVTQGRRSLEKGFFFKHELTNDNGNELITV